MSAAVRLRAVNLIIVIGCLASMAISFRAWVSAGTWGRSFPLAPSINGLPSPGFPWDVAQIAVAAALLLVSALSPRQRIFKTAVLLAMAWLILLDQSRLQPWLYQYLMMLGVLACGRMNSERDGPHMLGTLRLIIICTYIFCGLHKVNVSFVHETAPMLLRPLRALLLDDWMVSALGWSMPLIEILAGVFLAMRLTRRWGVMLAIAMHLVILLLIGPLGTNDNPVVWPWNMAMMITVGLLFWNVRDRRAVAGGSARGIMRSTWSHSKVSAAARAARVAVIVLAAIVPIGSIFGWMDAHLSWGMLASPSPLAAIKMNDDVISRLPEPLRKHVQTVDGTVRGIMILDWSFAELHLAYPEERIYRRVAKALAEYSESPEDMTLVLIHRPPRWSNQRTRTEIPLDAMP